MENTYQKLVSTFSNGIYTVFNTLFDKKKISTRAKTMKERLHWDKSNSNFEIVSLFHHLEWKGKSAAISKLELFFTE